MSCMKNFAETVSEELGFAGELTPEALLEASRQLLQQSVNRNAKLRTALRLAAGQSGSTMPIRVVNDPTNPSPMLAGESWHYETRGGRRIYHPSAYARIGWSNMCYRCSTRRIEVDADWLADNLTSLVQ